MTALTYYYSPAPLDLKALKPPSTTDPWTVSGYLAVFGQADLLHDIIMPGAFDASLASKRAVKFLFEHAGDRPLGPPLELRVDDHGLFAEGKLSKTGLGQDVRTWLLDGALDSWSIGYIAKDVTFKETETGDVYRMIRSLDLFEGSLVSVPAQPEAVVTEIKSITYEEQRVLLEECALADAHSCRVRSVSDFEPDSFRRSSRKIEGKPVQVIMGKLKGEEEYTVQSYRYPKKDWEADAAKSHCRGHKNARFETASEQEQPKEKKEPKEEKGLDGPCDCLDGTGLTLTEHATHLAEFSAALHARLPADLTTASLPSSLLPALRSLTDRLATPTLAGYSPRLALDLRARRLRARGIDVKE